MGSANWIGTPLNDAGDERINAAAALGFTPTGLVPFFHPTAAQGNNGLSQQLSGAPSTAAPASGSYLLSTTAVAAQFARLIGMSNGSTFTMFARAGQPWYAAARFKITTAITAQTKAYIGFGDSGVGGSLRMGVDGAISTAFFVLAGSAGGSIITTIPIDTVVHTFRAWRVGGTTFFQIDGGAIFTGTTDIAADGSPFVHVENGTDAVNRALAVVWFAAYCPSL